MYGRYYGGKLVVLLVILFVMTLHTPIVSMATENVTEETSEETEEVETESWAGRAWKTMINAFKDYFVGPAYDERPDIGKIKDITPYDQLGDIAFSDGIALDEVKDVSSSFYHLVTAISVLGMVLSFIVGGLSIAWNRKMNKADTQDAILAKIFVFIIIFSITGLWGMFVPLLKILDGA